MPLPGRSSRRGAAASSTTPTLKPPAGCRKRLAGVRICACVLLALAAYAAGSPALALPRAGGQAGLILGSLVPVQSSVRGVRDDFIEHPTNVYRRRLSAAQYARLMRVVGGLRRSDREWDLLFKNCNDFAITVAKGMGMATPPSWLLPYYFVGGLRLLNGP